MRLGGRRSTNVEDRRGGGARIVAGGGIGSIVVVVLLLFLGVDPSVLMEGGGGREPPRSAIQGGGPRADDPGARFVSQVLAETEDVWHPAFEAIGRRYEEPRLVLYTGVAQSACGTAPAQVGPFYCPPDRRIYIDLDFLAQLQRRLGAPGEFAAAYVIAHEVGHHVQNLLGILARVDTLKRNAAPAEANALSVRLELQADCLAGLWARRAHDARQILEDGDVEQGLAAAAAVGDDHMRRRAGGAVQPETFTHGSSAQRVRWFRRGLESGRLEACDTFSPAQI